MWSMLHPLPSRIPNSAKVHSDHLICAFNSSSHGRWVLERDIFALKIEKRRKYGSDTLICAFKNKSHGRWVFDNDVFDIKIEKRRKHDESNLLEATEDEMGLIPDEWISLQAGLHMSRAERKREIRLKETEEAELKALRLRQKREQLKTISGSFDANDDECSASDRTPEMQQISAAGKNNPITLEKRKRMKESDFQMLNEEERIRLIQVTDWTQIQCGKWPVLHTLVSSGQFILLDELLRLKIELNSADEDGYTAIQRAVLARKETAVSQLLRAGASIHVYDKDGAGLLHLSAQTGSLNLVRLFTKHGLDVNQCDKFGWTPLHIATLASREDIVRHLLISGSNKSLRTKNGHTALDICLALGKGFRTYAVAKSLKLLPKVDGKTRTEEPVD